jgi:hypothetical protein
VAADPALLAETLCIEEERTRQPTPKRTSDVLPKPDNFKSYRQLGFSSLAQAGG